MNSKIQNAKNPQSPDLSLTPDQQELLLTALSSNRPTAMAPNLDSFTRASNIGNPGTSHLAKNPANLPALVDPHSSDSKTFQSPVQASPGSGKSSSGNLDQSPFLDYDLDDGNFDWDNNGQSLFGNLPEAPNEDDGELHEKRKNLEDEKDGEENDSKRREGEEKFAKKAGRKPMTGEPTTKRKAQNRAAQRAFRERKERHLKDLEIKVDDLEKASEAANHENGRLRAQVDRLNIELREYRKRLSLNGTGGGGSPPSAASFSQSRGVYNNSFDIQFAFPKFGDLPGSNFMSNGSLAKVGAPGRAAQQPASSVIPGVLRTPTSSSAQAESPATVIGSFQVGSPEPLLYSSPTNTGKNVEDLKGFFPPSILESPNRSNSSDYSTAQSSRKTPFPENPRSRNDGPVGSTITLNASPSISSMTNIGLDSSCGTSPEPSADSPDNRKGSEGDVSTVRQASADLTPLTFTNSPVYDVNGIDWMAQQNGGQFDPVLFGGYRDPHQNILNNFDPDFFNDAFNDQDFSTPFYTGEPTGPATKRDLMREIEVRQNGIEDEIAPGKIPKNSLPCGRIWDQLSESERLQARDFDLDGLCSQLKAKAICSGGGLTIDQKDVDAILGPIPSSSQKDSFQIFS